MSERPSASPARLALFVALSSGVLGLVAIYFASATSMLRMPQCPAFSFTAPDPDCRTAMYWATASAVLLGTAVVAMVVGVALRRRLKASIQ